MVIINASPLHLWWLSARDAQSAACASRRSSRAVGRLVWLAASTETRIAMDKARVENEARYHQVALGQLDRAEELAKTATNPYEAAQAIAALGPEAYRALSDAY